MPFTSLKRKSPASDTKQLSIEQFIDGAEEYANGNRPSEASNVVNLPLAEQNKLMSQAIVAHHQGIPQSKKGKMIRATFTLTPECKARLDKLSYLTGESRSGLIRQWLNNQGLVGGNDS